MQKPGSRVISMSFDAPAKILIIQTAYVGDVILLTGFIRSLKHAFPGAMIDVIIIPQAQNILENNPDVSEIIIYDKRCGQKGIAGLFSMIRKIRRRYSVIFAPHRSLRTSLIAFFSGTSERIGFDKNTFSFLYTKRARHEWGIHEVRRNLLLLKSIKSEINEFAPRIFPDEKDFVRISEILEGNTGAKVALAPGSQWQTKRWPAERYQRLAELLTRQKVTVFLVGAASDRQLAQKISNKNCKIVNLAGELTMRQSALLLKNCDCLVSNDSAPVHLASAMDVPTIAIFGSTIPAFGFGPFHQKSIILEKKLSCRPCGLHGRKLCPIGTHDCMNQITVDMVLEKVNLFLKENSTHERY